MLKVRLILKLFELSFIISSIVFFVSLHMTSNVLTGDPVYV